MRNFKWKQAAACLPAIALTLIATSCASSDGDAPSSAEATQAGDLGEVNKAAGTPVVLGLTNMEGGAVSFPQYRVAAEAAVEYVNEHLGGIHGSPIKLVTCATDGSPGASGGCANKIIDAHPVAVLGGPDFGTAASMPIFNDANLAYIGGTPFQAPEMQDPNSIQFTGFAAGVFPALAIFATQSLDAKSVAVIYPEIPSAVNANEKYIIPVLNATGVTDVKSVGASTTTPDFSSIVADAMTANPDVIIDQDPGPNCVAIMQSLSTLGSQSKLLMPGSCSDPTILEAAGDAANGAYYSSNFDPINGDTKDVVLFRAAMSEYAPKDVVMNEFTQAGFGSVMNLWDAFNAIDEGDLSTASILDEFKSAPDRPNFMAHPYTCGVDSVPGAPAICNAAQRILKIVDGQPELVDDQWYDGSQYIGN